MFLSKCCIKSREYPAQYTKNQTNYSQSKNSFNKLCKITTLKETEKVYLSGPPCRDGLVPDLNLYLQRRLINRSARRETFLSNDFKEYIYTKICLRRHFFTQNEDFL